MPQAGSNQRRPIAIDLFAGAGGFSLGLEQAGFDVAVAVECDPVHAAVYAFNFPHTQILPRDIATLSGRGIRESLSAWERDNGRQSENGEIDLIFGGPPCQGFSFIGKRQPDDARNNLVFEFSRIVRELQPRYFIMENVPGLDTSQYSPILTRLLGEFETAGYVIAQPVMVLNAADFGVPQKRQRLFLLGTRLGAKAIHYPKPDRLPCEYVTVRDAIADLPNLDNFAELHKNDCTPLTPEQLNQLTRTATPYVQKLRDLAPDLNNFAYSRLWQPQLLTSSTRTRHTEASIERFLATPLGKIEPISRLRRLDWDTPCHTLRAGTGSERGAYTSPRPIHPRYPRVISVREAARLHSFPDWFRLHATKWHGFRQVGNAVPPLLGRALGQQVVAALDVCPPVPKESIVPGCTQLLQLTLVRASRYWQAPSGSRSD